MDVRQRDDVEIQEPGRIGNHFSHDAPFSTSMESTPMQSRRQSGTHDDDERLPEPAPTDDQPFALDEQEDPLNWTDWQKWCLTIIVSLSFVNTTLASSMATGATQAYIDTFGVSTEVATLALSCYMIGFSLGPLLWSPLSELMGRKWVFVIAIPCFGFINIGCALAQNMPTLLVLRVLAGFFGACPQSAAGATIADIWSPIQRSWPMLCYSTCAFMGPVCGPMTGGFLYVSGHWRWIYWMLAIFAGVNTLLLVAFQRETYAPVLRSQKAKRARAEDEKRGIKVSEKAPLDMRMTWSNIFSVYLVRPFSMLFSVRELPLLYAAIWTGWAYALLFLFFEAYPVIFQGMYGFNAGESGLCFLAFGIGILAGFPVIWYYNRASMQVVKQGGQVVPEARLTMVAFTAPLYVVGFFWFGWTSRKDVPWIVPVVATVPIGMSTILSFNAMAVYISQCYHIYAASALGSMAFSRCFVAVFVPLFGRQMFENLGPGWAASILAFVSLVAIPVPFLFLRMGKQIRAHSKLAIST